MIKPEKLQFWIANRWNVLFEGKHGTGKTSMVIDAFEKANLRWRYFSAATMDPWVDFIGVPKERHTSTGASYLELIRPQEFQDDMVEALFFDEFNRAHKKVRNAVMELLQFKSINGRKYKNLKCIWGAINPADESDTYDVEPLDPAQKDRFHIHIQVPYEPDMGFFNRTYGDPGRAACMWWDRLPVEQQNLISPRRLDYAIGIFKADGDLRDVLPVSCNVPTLITYLTVGPVEDMMCEFMTKKNNDEAREFMANENVYRTAAGYINGANKLMSKSKTNGSVTLTAMDPTTIRNFYLPLIPKEKLASLIVEKNDVANHCCMQWSIYKKTLITLFKAGCNKNLTDKIHSYINADASNDEDVQEVRAWIAMSEEQRAKVAAEKAQAEKAQAEKEAAIAAATAAANASAPPTLAVPIGPPAGQFVYGDENEQNYREDNF